MPGNFQILQEGRTPPDQFSFPTLGQASAAWLDGGEVGQIVQVDAAGEVIQRYTRQQCEEAAKPFLTAVQNSEAKK